MEAAQGLAGAGEVAGVVGAVGLAEQPGWRGWRGAGRPGVGAGVACGVGAGGAAVAWAPRAGGGPPPAGRGSVAGPRAPGPAARRAEADRAHTARATPYRGAAPHPPRCRVHHARSIPGTTGGSSPRPGGNMAFRGLDYYGIDELLTEEERLVRDTVRDFVDARIMPGIGKHWAAGTFPRELIAVFGEMGLLGSSLTGYGCAGTSPTPTA